MSPSIQEIISRVCLADYWDEYASNIQKVSKELLEKNMSELIHEYCRATAKLFSEKWEMTYESVYASYFSQMFDHVLSAFSNEQIEKNILS